jgi:hypothetical protein
MTLVTPADDLDPRNDVDLPPPRWRPILDPAADIAGPLEDDETGRCRSLWRAVIVQALRDALSAAAGAARVEARRWLLSAGRDLEAVCDLAEIDPVTVRATARRLIASGVSLPSTGACDA